MKDIKGVVNKNVDIIDVVNWCTIANSVLKIHNCVLPNVGGVSKTTDQRIWALGCAIIKFIVALSEILKRLVRRKMPR